MEKHNAQSRVTARGEPGKRMGKHIPVALRPQSIRHAGRMPAFR